MEQSCEQLIEAVDERRRCFLSTPNVNFLVAARTDPAFRNSVLASDLSVADGMPIVWISRLLGLPIRERVAGASLIGELDKRAQARPIRCFFFGGEGEAAERACRNVGVGRAGLVCAGALNPGMGSAARLSKPAFLDQINAQQADFLIVSLGARKGQEWIMRNATDIGPPVISHLGAVVNFLAGTVKRAPDRMQRLGLEWFWRITQEPALVTRYLKDGLILAWLVATRVVPLAISQLARRNQPAEDGKITCGNADNDGTRWVLEGSFGEGNMDSVRQNMADAAAEGGNIELDFSMVTRIDAAFTGTLLLLLGHCQATRRSLRLVSVPPGVAKTLRRQGAEYLLEP